MLVTWAVDEHDEIDHAYFSRRPDREPVLSFERQRFTGTGSPTAWVEYVVTHPDGPVIASARKWMAGERCGARMGGASGDHATLMVWLLPEGDDDGCVVLGPDGLYLGMRNLDPGIDSWFMSDLHPIRRTVPEYVRYSLDFATSEVIYDAREAGLPLTGIPTPVGEDVVFSGGDLLEVAAFGWRPGTGLVTLERFPGDPSRAALAVGGDGEHLVWTRAEDRPAGEAEYPTRSVMVSPYTFDADALQPVRLRSDPGAVISDPWIVGCGYAAQDGAGYDLQVVRLDDGRGWTLSSASPESVEWRWESAIGLTCEHLYARVYAGDHATIVRVRLDSLGEGSPPD
jgi:hypothetical protein